MSNQHDADIEKLEKLERSDSVLKAKLNLETAKITWSAVERLFASGYIIYVHRPLDLVSVGFQFARDDSQQLQIWLKQRAVHPLTDEQARDWHQNDNEMWALVIKPWVLVQNDKS